MYTHKVIARTAEGIEAITHSAEMVGVAKPEPLAPEVIITSPSAPSEPETKATTIPVVTLEPSDGASSCRDIFEPPVPAQPAKKPIPRPSGKNTPRKGDK
ncbi:MAG: hypothetical protein ACSLEN_01270 [Candidatus Malihini olakiniferum]